MHKSFDESQVRSMFLDVSNAIDRYGTNVLHEAIAQSFSRYRTKVSFAA